MNNLIPEKRMDRNGKLVTKHVKSAPSASNVASKIPAPSVGGSAKAVAISQARRPVYKEIMQRTGSAIRMKAKDWDYVRQYLAPLSDDELSGLVEAMNYSREFSGTISEKYFKIAIRSGHVVNAVQSMKTILSGASPADYSDPHKTFGGVMLGGAERLLEDDWTIPEGKENAVRARLLATQAIIEHCGHADGTVQMSPIGAYHLNSFELGNFIHENADRGDEIVAAIQSRRSADPGILRELMNHDVKSLNDGVL